MSHIDYTDELLEKIVAWEQSKNQQRVPVPDVDIAQLDIRVLKLIKQLDDLHKDQSTALDVQQCSDWSASLCSATLAIMPEWDQFRKLFLKAHRGYRSTEIMSERAQGFRLFRLASFGEDPASRTRAPWRDRNEFFGEYILDLCQKRRGKELFRPEVCAQSGSLIAAPPAPSGPPAAPPIDTTPEGVSAYLASKFSSSAGKAAAAQAMANAGAGPMLATAYPPSQVDPSGFTAAMTDNALQFGLETLSVGEQGVRREDEDPIAVRGFATKWTRVERQPKKYGSREACWDAVRNVLIEDSEQLFPDGRTAREKFVDTFMREALGKLTFAELQLLLCLPWLQVTLTLLKACGLDAKPATDQQQALIYVKFAKGKVGTMDAALASANTRTKAFAEDAKDFVDSAPGRRDDLNQLGVADEHCVIDASKVTFTHVGRMCTGPGNRVVHEDREIANFRLNDRSRFWATVLATAERPVGQPSVTYFVLSDLSEHTGFEWSWRLKWYELFWAILLGNALLTNSALPGLDVPTSPILPYGVPAVRSLTEGIKNVQEQERTTTQMSEGYYSAERLLELRVILAEFGLRADHLTLECLTRAGYRGCAHPLWYLTDYRSIPTASDQFSGCVLVKSLDVPFDVAYSVGKHHNDIKLTIQRSCFVLGPAPEQGEIVLRPCGLFDKDAPSVVSVPIFVNVVLNPSNNPHKGLWKRMLNEYTKTGKNGGVARMSLSYDPVDDRNHKRRFRLQDEQGNVLLSPPRNAGQTPSPVYISLQDEASELLVLGTSQTMHPGQLAFAGEYKERCKKYDRDIPAYNALPDDSTLGVASALDEQQTATLNKLTNYYHDAQLALDASQVGDSCGTEEMIAWQQAQPGLELARAEAYSKLVKFKKLHGIAL